MKPLLQVFTYMIITLTVIICQKDGDEGRAYEFGFTIDGQQHRHEKKDQNGIIQGEFGFITADGIYHVTVYATDENGNFKILSMRNIRISAPLDGSPATGPISPEAGKYLKKSSQTEQPKITSAILPTSPQKFEKLQQLPMGPQAQNIITTERPRTPYVFTTKPTIKPACGGCGYVTTAKPTSSPVKTPVSTNPVSSFQHGPSINQNLQFGQFNSGTQGQNQSPLDVELLPPSFSGDNLRPGSAVSTQSHQTSFQSSQIQGLSGVNLTPNIGFQNSPSVLHGSDIDRNSQMPSEFGRLPNGPPTGFQNDKLIPNVEQPNLQTHQNLQMYQNSVQQNVQSLEGNNQNQNSFVQNQDQQGPAQGNENVLPNIPEFGGITNSGHFGLPNNPASGSTRPNILPSIPAPKLPPVSVSENIIHVGGKNPMDIPIKDKFPGMVDGLPNGVKETDVTGILYKFKYTVGFHGHYETGLKNGTVIGGYFVNGRDGISRVVTYVADENGYRPKIKFINLGLDSSDTPNEKTEKTFGLKSFEFVWYPIE